MQSLFQILMLLLDILWFFIIAHVIMSWLINFQVLNVRQQFVGQIWYGLNRLLEPLYAPIRRVLPNMGGLDLAPLVVLTSDNVDADGRLVEISVSRARADRLAYHFDFPADERPQSHDDEGFS